jgi:DNA modification methylase
MDKTLQEASTDVPVVAINPVEKLSRTQGDLPGKSAVGLQPEGTQPKRVSRVSAQELSIDPALTAALPPVPEPVRTALRESILRDGVISPLYVYGPDKNILDGIARFEIAVVAGIKELPVVEVDLADDTAAKAFRVEVNLARRQLNAYQRCIAILRLAGFYRALARHNQVKGGQGKTCRKEDRVDVLTELSQRAMVSRDTLARVRCIERDLEKAVGSARCEEARTKLADGEKTIAVVYSDIKRALQSKRLASPLAPVPPSADGKNESEENASSSTAYENQIIRADAIDGLKRLPDGSVTAVITSPPYLGVGTTYDGVWDDEITYQQYLVWLKNVLKECSRVLRVGGRCAINIDAIHNRRDDTCRIYPIFADLVALFRDREVNLKFFGDIAWVKQNVTGKKMALGSRPCPNIRRNHEYIIIAAKAQFRLPQIGNQPSDLTNNEFHSFSMSTWAIPPVHRRKGDIHPHAYPEQLVERLVKLFTCPGDLVVDPFLGSGTTTAVAARLGRKYFGVDKNASYVAAARKRTENAAKAITDASVKPLLAAHGRKPAEEGQQSDTHEPETRTAA